MVVALGSFYRRLIGLPDEAEPQASPPPGSVPGAPADDPGGMGWLSQDAQSAPVSPPPPSPLPDLPGDTTGPTVTPPSWLQQQQADPAVQTVRQQFQGFDDGSAGDEAGPRQPTPVSRVADDPGGTQALIEDTQRVVPEISRVEPVRPGRVQSTPGEPDYVPPPSRGFLEPTRGERERAQKLATESQRANATPSILDSTPFSPRRAMEGLQVVGEGVRYLQGRFDPVQTPALAKAGIITSLFAPKTVERIQELTQKQVGQSQYAQMDPAERQELQGYLDIVERRYNQIKNDPDELNRYAEEAPLPEQGAWALVTMLAGLGAGGVLRAGAGQAARAARLSPRAIQAAEYTGDVVGQSVFDPTNVVAQPLVDAALDAARRGRRPVQEGFRAVQDALASTDNTSRGVWEVFDATTSQPVGRFATETEARREAQRLTQTTGLMHDYEAMPVPSRDLPGTPSAVRSDVGPRLDEVPEESLGAASQDLRQRATPRESLPTRRDVEGMEPDNARRRGNTTGPGLFDEMANIIPPRVADRQDIPLRPPEYYRDVGEAYYGDVDYARSTGLSQAKAPAGWDTIDAGPGAIEQRADEAGRIQTGGRVSGAVAGGLTGGAAGATSTTDEQGDADLRVTAIATLLGSLAGAAAGPQAVRAVARRLDQMVREGRLPSEWLNAHPRVPARVDALMLLASQGQPDEAVISIPRLAQALTRMDAEEMVYTPADRDRMHQLLQDGVTAGDVRRLVEQPGRIEQATDALKEMALDLLTGRQNRRQRLRESAADAATIQPLASHQLEAAWELHRRAGTWTPPADAPSPFAAGARIYLRSSDDPITQLVRGIADEMGLPPPFVYQDASSSVNAAAGPLKKTGQGAVIVTDGLLDSGLTTDELQSVLRHEMAHIGEQSTERLQAVLKRGKLRSRNTASSSNETLLDLGDDQLGATEQARHVDLRQASNPHIQDMARQMAGDYREGDATKRSLGERIVMAYSDRTATAANLDREAKAKAPSLTTRLQDKIRVNAGSVAHERATKEIAPALKLVGPNSDGLAQYLVYKHNLDIADEVERSVQQGVLSRDIDVTDLTANERARLTMAKNEQRLADASETRLSAAVERADAELAAAKDERDRLVEAVAVLMRDPDALVKGKGYDTKAVKQARKKLAEVNRQRAMADMRVARAEERVARWKQQIDENRVQRVAELQNRRMELAAIKGAEARAGRKFAGDMDVDATQQALADLQAMYPPEEWAKIERAADMIWESNRKTLERKMESGQISREVYDRLREAYPHYVRTDIADYFEKNNTGPMPGGQQLGLSNIGLRRIKTQGSTKDRVNPLISTLDYLYAGEASVARNNATHDLVEIRDSDPSYMQLFKEVSREREHYVRHKDSDMWVPPDYTLKKGEVKVTDWRNGEPRQFIVPPEYAGLVAPDNTKLLGDSSAAQAFRTMMSFLKGVLTTYNPGFQYVVSPFRDFNDAMISMSTYAGQKARREGASDIENYAREFAAGFTYAPVALKRYLEAIPLALHGIRTGEHHPRVAELMAAGSGFESRPGRDERSLRFALDELERTGGMRLQTAQDYLRFARDVVTLGAYPVGARVEMVGRIAQANQMRDFGDDILAQSMGYKDATIDFLRGGYAVRQMNVPFMFLNATVQSAAQVARKIRQSPAGFLGAATAGVAIPAMLAEAWNRSDPERAKRYEDRPDYLKDTGIIWELDSLPESTGPLGEKKPNYIWMPLGSHAFVARIAREALSPFDPVTGLRRPTDAPPGYDANDPWSVARYYAREGMSLVNTFSPVKGESVGAVAGGLLPPGLSEAIELSIDRDLYRGNQITTERADERASTLSKGVARGMNRALGTEIRPSQVEHATRGPSGYLGQVAHGAVDLAAGRDIPGERPIQDIPGVGPFAGRLVRDSGGQVLENLRETDARVPASVRPILAQAEMRTDQIRPVPNRYEQALLTNEEQAKWQRAFNQEFPRALNEMRGKADWSDKNKRKGIVEEAVRLAQDRAAKRTLQLDSGRIQSRIQREESQRKASR